MTTIHQLETSHINRGSRYDCNRKRQTLDRKKMETCQEYRLLVMTATGKGKRWIGRLKEIEKEMAEAIDGGDKSVENGER